MGNLVVFLKTEIVPNWRWRDRFGNFHYVTDMETRHLFFTLRMIWNNTMPPHARVGNVRLYRFDPFYTKEYFMQAIAHIGRELMYRTLTKMQINELDQMAKYFSMRLEEDSKKISLDICT